MKKQAIKINNKIFKHVKSGNICPFAYIKIKMFVDFHLKNGFAEDKNTAVMF